MLRKIDKEVVRIRSAMEQGMNRIAQSPGETHESWRRLCERLIPLLVAKGYIAKVTATESVPGTYDPSIPSTYKLWLLWEEAPEQLPPYVVNVKLKDLA